MQKMEETMKSMKYQTDDISSIEHSRTSVNFELTEMRTTMNKVSEAFIQ